MAGTGSRDSGGKARSEMTFELACCGLRDAAAPVRRLPYHEQIRRMLGHCGIELINSSTRIAVARVKIHLQTHHHLLLCNAPAGMFVGLGSFLDHLVFNPLAEDNSVPIF